MAPMAKDTAHKHISLDANISGLASVLLMAPYYMRMWNAQILKSNMPASVTSDVDVADHISMQFVSLFRI